MPSLISTQSISKSYGSRPLFSNISLTVGEDERIGLIGANGSGKSTLLRLLAGFEKPDDGEIARRRNLKLGFVAQEDVFDEGVTVEGVLREGASESFHHEIERDTQVAVMLGRVGFAQATQTVDILSGGWKKRLAIAAALIREPDLLLLDEPTNHLDLEGILWLESLLSSLAVSCVLISHDRYFLERTVNRIVELGRQYPEGCLSFGGAYADFLSKREDYLFVQQKREDALAGQVRKEIEWLRRGPPARTTKAKYRIDEAGKMIEELGDLRDRNAKETVSRLDFSASGRKTRDLIVAKGLTLRGGDRVLVDGLDLTLTPKMRLGILGPNGSGKTTLLRALVGERPADGGTIEQAERLRVVYFSQDRQHVPRQMSLRQALAGEGDTVTYNGSVMHVTAWAKRFLFRTEQLELVVDRLSGGEQARVLIARLMLEPADVLILDEPTNDLDIPTLDVLEESLSEFPGAIALVTHDRYILDRVSTELLALDGLGGARHYAGYDQWESHQSASPFAESPITVGKSASPATPVTKATPPDSAAKGKLFRGLTRPEQRELDRMEEAISSAESNLTALEQSMASPDVASDYVKLQDLIARCEEARGNIEALYARWQDLEAKVTAE